MQLTQALTLVPERQREEEDKEPGHVSMDKIIDFLTSPVRDMPLIEFDLPKILAFYSNKGKDDNEAKNVMAEVRDFLKDAWKDSGEEDNLVSRMVESIVTKSVRRLGSFLIRTIVGAIWRITKWLVKEIVKGVVRNVLRYIVMPAIEAMVGFLLTPAGIALAITGGALAGAYFVYKAFFTDDKEKPKSEEDDISKTEDGSDATTVASNLLRQPEATTTPSQGSTSIASAPPRTSEASLNAAAAPMAAGAPVAAGPPPSGDVKQMIIKHEGFKLQPYKDSLGLWTVGVGHLIGDGKSLPAEWNRTFTKDEVLALFDQDFEHHRKAAMNIPNFGRLGEKAQAALIDLTFNMGPGWYRRWPKLVEAMKNFDIAAVIDNLRNSKWAKQVQASRVSDVLSLLATEVSGTAVASETPKMVPGTTTAATKQKQIADRQAENHPGTAVTPPPKDKTIIRTPDGKLVAANM